MNFDRDNSEQLIGTRMTRVYLFDLDGTLADLTHRLHHIKTPVLDTQGKMQPPNWDAFYAACVDDKPIQHMVDLLDAIANDNTVVYVTGRSDQCREQTADWMEKHDLPPGQLYMRKAGDHRQNHVVKAELVDRIIADGMQPVMAFEDRTQVVKMLRERGIPCLQVAEGDY